MLFNIEKYIIRMSTRYLRRCFSQNVNAPYESQEFVSQKDNDFKLIHRENRKVLKIAVLGAPNVGKSTIINQLIKRSVCPSSSKVHTTQTKARAIYCEDDTQLIFMDTPGMVSKTECKRFQLASTFRNDPKDCLKTSDIVGIVQDAHNIHTRNKIDPNILELLNEDIRNKIPLILIFNKVDKLKKKEVLLHLVNALNNGKNSLNFCDIFMISALTGDGIDDLRGYLLDSAKPQDWHYEEHVCSDHTYEEIIEQTVRAKLMDNLPNEIPYKLNVKLEYFDVAIVDNIRIMVTVTCPKKRIMALLLRSEGKKIKIISRIAEEELRNAFRTIVKLKITVKCST